MILRLRLVTSACDRGCRSMWISLVCNSNMFVKWQTERLNCKLCVRDWYVYTVLKKLNILLRYVLLKLFLYLLELVLRTLFKPRLFPLWNFFRLLWGNVIRGLWEQANWIKYDTFRPRRTYLCVSWFGRDTVTLRKTLTLSVRLLVKVYTPFHFCISRLRSCA